MFIAINIRTYQGRDKLGYFSVEHEPSDEFQILGYHIMIIIIVKQRDGVVGFANQTHTSWPPLFICLPKKNLYMTGRLLGVHVFCPCPLDVYLKRFRKYILADTFFG